MKYRADIDGLRGVAVLLVVLFHSGLSFFPGGFIGVDIFFVISGYLITSIILEDIRQQRFSYVGFYERRIRRILPALYFMMLIVMAVALFIQMPVDLIKTAKTVLFATLFSSNIFFWRTTDYFSGNSDFELFLHTWSLGVEEQFYFIFPLVILLFFHRGRWLLIMTLCALVISFIISVYTSYFHQWASYYMLPSRAWQMMAGALVAIACITWQPNKIVRNFLACLALACIFIPALLYSKTTRFPGVAAVLPTMGSALFIFLGGLSHSNKITQMISMRWLSGVGLISYSLYLWHWPIFAFLRTYEADTRLPLLMSIGGIFLSFLLAYLSWRYIEAPFRNREKISRRSIFVLAGIFSAVIIIICLSIVAYKGFPARVPTHVVELSSVSESGVIDDPCLAKKVVDIQDGNVCTIGKKQAPLSIAFWGDSHLGALKLQLSNALERIQVQGEFLAKVGCPPLLDVIKVGTNNERACLEFNNAVFQRIIANDDVNTVVLHARWALSVEGSRYFKEQGPSYVLRDADAPHLLNNSEVVAGTLRKTVNSLLEAGKRVVIIASVPEIGVPVPRVIANNLMWNKTRDIRPTSAEFSQRQKNTDKILQDIIKLYPSVKMIKPSDVLCDNSHCEVMENEKPLYFDDDHLSDMGSYPVVQLLLKSL